MINGKCKLNCIFFMSTASCRYLLKYRGQVSAVSVFQNSVMLDSEAPESVTCVHRNLQVRQSHFRQFPYSGYLRLIVNNDTSIKIQHEVPISPQNQHPRFLLLRLTRHLRYSKYHHKTKLTNHPTASCSHAVEVYFTNTFTNQSSTSSSCKV